MDPTTLILTALGAGAVLGLGDTASAAVKDAHQGLKELLMKRFTGREDGKIALTQYEKSPDKWEPMLARELTRAGADQDSDLVAAAHLLLGLTDPARPRAGKYNIIVPGGQGVMAGDHNMQTNTFGAPTGPVSRTI